MFNKCLHLEFHNQSMVISLLTKIIKMRLNKSTIKLSFISLNITFNVIYLLYKIVVLVLFHIIFNVSTYVLVLFTLLYYLTLKKLGT